MTQTLLTQDQRLEYMLRLVQVARRTGQAVLKLSPDTVFDTFAAGQHHFSTVDTQAGQRLRAAIARIMSDLPVSIAEETEIAQRSREEIRKFKYPLIVADAVEGSTNATRGLTARIQRPIRSGTSLMLLENESLGSVAASAFFDFSSGRVFSAVRGEQGSFLSFVNRKVITPSDIAPKQDYSQKFVAVPGYSHGDVEARAQVERVLLNAGFCTTGGSRSSAQDLLSIVAGSEIDAYADLRVLFPATTDRHDAVLHPWDVGGVLPVMDGLGLMVADTAGESWQKYRFFDQLALIVARPSIGPSILAAIRQLPFIEDQAKEERVATIPHPLASVS